MNADQWLQATIEAKIAHAEARAFWQGVCAMRAELADERASLARFDARICLLSEVSAYHERQAEIHEQRAAWLRACAEEA